MALRGADHGTGFMVQASRKLPKLRSCSMSCISAIDAGTLTPQMDFAKRVGSILLMLAISSMACFLIFYGPRSTLECCALEIEFRGGAGAWRDFEEQVGGCKCARTDN